jgi:HD superfamily phosphohydrolase
LSQRNYRDSLHDIISLDESVPDDKLIVDLIDSSEFQRLRRIRQLGLAMFTYQGAEHSRFTHSIGVMHLMTRALQLLGSRHQISEEARVVGRAGALLHDLGHGPFSHVVEKVFGFHHEDWTRRIVLDPSTQVNRVLRDFDRGLPERLAALYDKTFQPAFVGQLVSSQLDCDRMDYLLRDSLMTGAKYGIFDLEWVLYALDIDEQLDRIYVEAKGLYAVEAYLQARYYMFRQVYFHRTLRSAEAVLTATLRRARVLVESGERSLGSAGLVLERLLTGQEASVDDYLQLDDNDLLFFLKSWSRDSDPVLRDLSGRLLDRRLFKAVDLHLEPDQLEDLWPEAEELSRSLGFDPSYYLVKDRASDEPYYGYYSPSESAPDNLIYVEDEAEPAIREISEISRVVKSLRRYRIDRLCFPAEVSQPMLDLLANQLKVREA